MTTYARLTAAGGVDRLVDLTPEQYAALQANGKAAWLRLWVVDTKPIPTVSQIVIDAGIVVGATEAHQTWAVREKAQAELDADQNAADKASLLAMIANLTTSIQMDRSTLTAAQKIAQLEQDSVRLSRIARYYLRSLQ